MSSEISSASDSSVETGRLFRRSKASCVCTQKTPFFANALLPPTCVWGNLLLFEKKVCTPNNRSDTATITNVIATSVPKPFIKNVRY